MRRPWKKMTDYNPLANVYVKDYSFSYDKNKKFMTLAFKDISDIDARAMKKNIKMWLSFYTQKFLHRFSYHNNIFKLIINLCPPEIAADFEKYLEFTKI